MLKEERQRRILEILASEGRVVGADLQRALNVSGYTIRRDLDELANDRRVQRVHGGALARSPVAATYEARQRQGVAGKIATARAAATLLEPGQVVILDGGSTALHLTARPSPPPWDGGRSSTS
jgi:DeoR/GlpR family transcriptional regulator of sugar metabolism